MQEYYTLIPRNLNLSLLLEINPPKFDFNIDLAHFLISEILKYSSNMKENNCYIPRCSEKLQQFNRDCKSHLKYLSEYHSDVKNVLWRDYYARGKCYSYKIAPSYQNIPLKQ